MALGILTGTAVFGVASMYLSRHEHDDRGIPIPSPDVQGSTRVALILGTMFLHSFRLSWRSSYLNRCCHPTPMMFDS